jgi:hypothetical protein
MLLRNTPQIKNRNQTWQTYSPNFESEKIFSDICWPWMGHKNFAYDLVSNFKPETIVELGTHYGTSFFSFCQAVKDQKYNSYLYAVDTWKGDKHAGKYNDSVYKTVVKIKNIYFKKLNVKLFRQTFNTASNRFKGHSIDLLHIDGLHTYEAVKHDFETWLPKVKDTGIIMFHDIQETKDDFGVYKLWQELKNKYRYIEFHHSHGLGIIFMSKNTIVVPENLVVGYYTQNYEAILTDTIIQQKQNIAEISEELSVIKSSKFFKLWPLYLKLKSLFM